MALSLLKKPSTLKANRPYLDWLFVAFYDDGNVVVQNQDDASKTGKGSTFTDVLAYPAKLTHFELRNGKQAVTVDLATGNFIVNGTPLQIHNQHFDPSKYELELTYFRETKAELVVKGTVQEDGSVEREDTKGAPYVNRYFLGWQADDKKQTNVTLAVG